MNQQHDSTGHQHTANLSSDMVVPDRSSQAVQDKFNVRSTPLTDEQQKSYYSQHTGSKVQIERM
jgi:hypothetical protein